MQTGRECFLVRYTERGALELYMYMFPIRNGVDVGPFGSDRFRSHRIGLGCFVANSVARTCRTASGDAERAQMYKYIVLLNPIRLCTAAPPQTTFLHCHCINIRSHLYARPLAYACTLWKILYYLRMYMYRIFSSAAYSQVDSSRYLLSVFFLFCPVHFTSTSANAILIFLFRFHLLSRTTSKYFSNRVI